MGNQQTEHHYKPTSGRCIKMPLVLLLILLALVLLIFKSFLFGDKTYLFNGIACDTYDLFYPRIYHITDYIAKNGLPKWSFNAGMGQSLFPLCLSDPFNLILYLAGKDHVLFGLAIKEVVKIILGGLVFYQYLKLLQLSNFTALFGSLAFAFCGYMLVGSFWYIFSAEAFMAAFLLMAFEQFFVKGKWYLFPISIMLILCSQPFNLLPYSIFLFSYILLRLFQTNGFKISKILGVFAQLMGLGVVGMLLAAPLLFENLNQLLESPRGSGIATNSLALSSIPVFRIADKLQLLSSGFRLVSNNLMGAGSNFNGWHNYLESPLFFCGLPCLLLLPQAIAMQGNRLRIFFIGFILIWLLPTVFPYFRHAFWLFTGDYYRAYSFVISLIILFFSLTAIEQILIGSRLNKVVLFITSGLLLLFLYYPYSTSDLTRKFPDRPLLNSNVLFIVTVLLLAYTIILILVNNLRWRMYAKNLFLFVFIFEIGWSSCVSVNNMDAISANQLAQKEEGYNDYSVEALDFIKKQDSSFYRIDKTFYFTEKRWFHFNDGMIQDYKGTTSYYSFNQMYYVLYLQLYGIADRTIEDESRWTYGLGNRSVLESLNQVKYIVYKPGPKKFRKVFGDSVRQFNDITVYKNRYTLPMGFTYRYFIKESAFMTLANDQKDILSLYACVVNDSEAQKLSSLKEFKLNDSIRHLELNDSIYADGIAGLGKETLRVRSLNDNLLSGDIHVNTAKIMYLSIPYDKGWLLKLDGKITDKQLIFGGMTGVYLTPGNHKISMAFNLPYFYRGLWYSLLGLGIYLVLFIKYKPR